MAVLRLFPLAGCVVECLLATLMAACASDSTTTHPPGQAPADSGAESVDAYADASPAIDDSDATDGGDADEGGDATDRDVADESGDATDRDVAAYDANADSSESSSCAASSYPGTECGWCMELYCSDACEVCQGDAECVAWLECASRCIDLACRDACTKLHPAGWQPALDWYGLSGCLGQLCYGNCASMPPYCYGDLVTHDEACDYCIAAMCCAEMTACAHDSTCMDCLWDASPACKGDAEYQDFMACWTGECGPSCIELYGCGLSTSGNMPDCDACIESLCCQPAIDCALGPDGDHNGQQDCIDALSCAQSCDEGDTACEAACASTYSDGAALMDGFIACLSASCADSCQF